MSYDYDDSVPSSEALWRRALRAPGLRQTCIEALAAAQDPIYLDLLLAVTDDDEPVTRLVAQQAVRKLMPQLPRDRLVAAAQDDRTENRTMRWLALEVLANRRDESALAPLLELARTPGTNHFLAYSNLFKFGHESAIEFLIDRLYTEPSFPLRMFLAHRLIENLPPERSVPVLSELLHDQDTQLQRFAASQILSNRGASAPAETVVAAREIIEEMHADAQVRHRAEHLASEREQQRAGFAREVAERGEPRTFAGWLSHLRNPNLEWQGLAWKTVMAMVPNPDMMEDLREALLNEDYQTAVGAAAILEWVGKHVPVTPGMVEAAFRRIDQLPADESYDKIAEELTNAFAELGAHMPTEPLVAALTEPNRRVRSLAMVALYHQRALLSHDLFLGVLRDPGGRVRSLAISALAADRPQIFAEIICEAADVARGHAPGPIFTPVVQIYFARELSHVREPSSSLIPEILDSLSAFLHSPAWGVRREGLAALGALAQCGVLDKRNLPTPMSARLLELVSDPESRAVREAASQALASLGGDV